MSKRETKVNTSRAIGNKIHKVRQAFNKIFAGTIRIRGHKIPKSVIAGLIGIIFMYVSVAGITSVATPWLGSSDTRQHVDYIWRLSHEQLPHWKDGLTYSPFVKIYGFKNQAASANPPLFYAIHTPFVSPLLREGKWEKAIAAGRAVNVFIGILCIFALSWAGWLYGGRRRELFSIAVPALSVMLYRFTRLNVDYALDALLVLFATLALINTYKLITKGLKTNYLLWAALLSVLGMATKATYVVVLAINLLGVLGAAYLHSTKKNLKKNMIKAATICGSIVLLVALAIGWFYYIWNYRTSGKWWSASPPGYTGGRVIVNLSIFQLLTNRNVLGIFYSNYSDSSLSIALTSFTLAGYFHIKRTSYVKVLRDKANLILIGLLSLTLIGTFATLLVLEGHTPTAVNFRYMLSATLVFGLFLAYGLSVYEWMKGQLIAFFSIGMGLSTLAGLGLFKRTKLYKATLANSITPTVPKILILLFFVGAVLLIMSLYKLSGRKPRASLRSRT